MSNKPDYMASVVEKLTLAGWIERSIRTDKPDAAKQFQIHWTPKGKSCLNTILQLFHDIESQSSTISSEEAPYLKLLAQAWWMTEGKSLPPPPPRQV